MHIWEGTVKSSEQCLSLHSLLHPTESSTCLALWKPGTPSWEHTDDQSEGCSLLRQLTRPAAAILHVGLGLDGICTSPHGRAVEFWKVLDLASSRWWGEVSKRGTGQWNLWGLLWTKGGKLCLALPPLCRDDWRSGALTKLLWCSCSFVQCEGVSQEGLCPLEAHRVCQTISYYIIQQVKVHNFFRDSSQTHLYDSVKYSVLIFIPKRKNGGIEGRNSVV